MSKAKKYKSIIGASLVLGVLVSIQLKSINQSSNNPTTSKKGEQLTQELKALKQEEETLKSNIESTKKKIDGYRDEDGESNKAIKDEIKKYEELAGYTKVKGKGINIKITQNINPINSNNNDDIIYNYDLLLSMINKLNSAQANAISINGQRIVASTYITSKNDGLYINEVPIKAPFTIKAIGNPDTLSSALQIKYGIVWEMEKYYNSKVEIKNVDNIEVEAYSGKLKSVVD